MTVKEFKAWLDGFMDNKKDPPTKKDWKKIQEKLDSVEAGAYPVSWRYYPYVEPYPYWTYPYWSEHPYCSTITSDNIPKSAISSTTSANTYKIDSVFSTPPISNLSSLEAKALDLNVRYDDAPLTPITHKSIPYNWNRGNNEIT